jgi:hypothetical protein
VVGGKNARSLNSQIKITVLNDTIWLLLDPFIKQNFVMHLSRFDSVLTEIFSATRYKVAPA